MDKKKGSRKSEFEVLKKLGQGSFGVVYQVRRKQNNEVYVMKEIDMRFMNTHQRREASFEAQLLSRIECEYVCKYVDSFVEDDKICIVMEYCENGDLGKYLKRQMGRSLEEPKIWKFFIEMCLGLHYLHSFKILHRDIKTINMFLGRGNQIKIGDLGVAKVLSQTNNMAHTIVGTPYYLSPELCEEKPYNHKSDIWSLGCVLYELCTFRHPFEANNQASLILKILRGRFQPIPTHYSSDMKNLVDVLLQKSQLKRPGLTEIFKMTSMREKMKLYGYELEKHQGIIDAKKARGNKPKDSSKDSKPLRSQAQSRRPPEKVPDLAPPIKFESVTKEDKNYRAPIKAQHVSKHEQQYQQKVQQILNPRKQYKSPVRSNPSVIEQVHKKHSEKASVEKESSKERRIKAQVKPALPVFARHKSKQDIALHKVSDSAGKQLPVSKSKSAIAQIEEVKKQKAAIRPQSNYQNRPSNPSVIIPEEKKPNFGLKQVVQGRLSHQPSKISAAVADAPFEKANKPVVVNGVVQNPNNAYNGNVNNHRVRNNPINPPVQKVPPAPSSRQVQQAKKQGQKLLEKVSDSRLEKKKSPPKNISKADDLIQINQKHQKKVQNGRRQKIDLLDDDEEPHKKKHEDKEAIQAVMDLPDDIGRMREEKKKPSIDELLNKAKQKQAAGGAAAGAQPSAPKTRSKWNIEDKYGSNQSPTKEIKPKDESPINLLMCTESETDQLKAFAAGKEPSEYTIAESPAKQKSEAKSSNVASAQKSDLPDNLVVANFKVTSDASKTVEDEKEDCAGGSDQAYYSGEDDPNHLPEDEVPYDVAFTEPVPIPRKKQVPQTEKKPARPVDSSDDETGFTHQHFNDNNELIEDDLEVPVMIEEEDPGFGVPLMNEAEEAADFEVEEREGDDLDYSEVTPMKEEDESLFEGLEDPNFMRESFKQMEKNFNAGIEEEDNVSDDDLTSEITTDVPSLSPHASHSTPSMEQEVPKTDTKKRLATKQKQLIEKKIKSKSQRLENLKAKKKKKVEEGEAVSSRKERFEEYLRFYKEKIDEQGEDGELTEQQEQEITEFLYQEDNSGTLILLLQAVLSFDEEIASEQRAIQELKDNL